jgi:CPA1 family monovalent cation:H+ antiporter
VVLSVAIVTGAVGAVTPLSWEAALLFGALITATDPIAVVALFKEMKVPPRLAVLTEGESLLNDAVALVLFSVVLTVARSGDVGPAPILQGAADFILVSVGGLGVGAVLAMVYAGVARLDESDPLVEIALSVVLAYSAFVVAHHYLHVSGIMAVVGAGLAGGALRRGHLEAGTRASLGGSCARVRARAHVEPSGGPYFDFVRTFRTYRPSGVMPSHFQTQLFPS